MVEIASGTEHEIPADAVTRDVRAPAAHGPLVPLAFRPHGDAFFLLGDRWAEFSGKPLRLGD